MPIFEYICRKCGGKFEKLVLDKKEEISCPKCGSKNAEKQFSSFAGGSSKGQAAGPNCPGGGCCPGCRHN